MLPVLQRRAAIVSAQCPARTFRLIEFLFRKSDAHSLREYLSQSRFAGAFDRHRSALGLRKPSRAKNCRAKAPGSICGATDTQLVWTLAGKGAVEKPWVMVSSPGHLPSIRLTGGNPAARYYSSELLLLSVFFPLRPTRLTPLIGATASVASIGRAREKRPVTPAATRSVR
jgi:hypothetical protein